jgi:amino acid permease
MPLVEYAKKNKKEFKESPKHPLINIFIYLFIFILIPFLGFTKGTCS